MSCAVIAPGAGRRDLDGVVPKVGHVEVVQQETAIGVRVGTHPPRAARRKCRELRHEASVRVEQFVRAVAPHPALEIGDVVGMRRIDEDRHLMGAERALDPQPVDLLRAGPAFRRAEHDHRPARPRRAFRLPRRLADAPDLLDHRIHGGRHRPVHRLGIVALDDVRRPAAA